MRVANLSSLGCWAAIVRCVGTGSCLDEDAVLIEESEVDSRAAPTRQVRAECPLSERRGAAEAAAEAVAGKALVSALVEVESSTAPTRHVRTALLSTFRFTRATAAGFVAC